MSEQKIFYHPYPEWAKNVQKIDVAIFKYIGKLASVVRFESKPLKKNKFFDNF